MYFKLALHLWHETYFLLMCSQVYFASILLTNFVLIFIMVTGIHFRFNVTLDL